MLVISFIIIGVLELILFAWRQLSIESPIMNLRTFRFPMFSLSVVLFIVVMMLLLSSMLLLPMLAHLPSSFVFGIKGAFIFAGVMSIIALFISLFMKRVKPSEQEAGLNQPESGTVLH
ncbi:hypothetical protein A8L34_07990 [Bacillus sp. FJAT-27264]|uniref:hypothetical protein n=1 Tax=Paenibacillus sp. (strain DSM 101736 / FJAT-27264) TaxID=1850362 RepID=UPI000807EF18|nr:hypothetical protein [Bacillus sp. FJAT-27264]OBZ19431.1 hypothetical protein A8L34_07990 [Bacillus sp. FJAT-27264]